MGARYSSVWATLRSVGQAELGWGGLQEFQGRNDRLHLVQELQQGHRTATLITGIVRIGRVCVVAVSFPIQLITRVNALLIVDQGKIGGAKPIVLVDLNE